MAQPQHFFAPHEPPPTFVAAPADPALKERISLLAKYVAQNGPSFLELVRSKQADNPEYAFLRDPHGYAYFRWVLFCALHSLPPDQPPHVQHGAQTAAASGVLPPPSQQAQQLPPDVAAAFQQILDSLTGSKESIKAASQWLVACAPQHGPGLARMVAQRLAAPAALDADRQTHLLYLCNDALFKALPQRPQAAGAGDAAASDPVAAALRPVLGGLLCSVFNTSGRSPDAASRLAKILGFWSERGVYDAATIQSFEATMHSEQPAAVLQQALAPPPAAAAAAGVHHAPQPGGGFPPPHQPHGMPPVAYPPGAGAAGPASQVQPAYQLPPPHPHGAAFPHAAPPPAWAPHPHVPPGAAAPPLAAAHLQPQPPGYGYAPHGPPPGQPPYAYPLPGAPAAFSAPPGASGYAPPPAAPQPPHGFHHHHHPAGMGNGPLPAYPPAAFPGAAPVMPHHHHHHHPHPGMMPPPPGALPPPHPPPGAFLGAPLAAAAAAPAAPQPAQPQAEPVSSFNFPPGLLPLLVKEKRDAGGRPYSPLSPLDIERVGLPPPPEKDPYLKSRMDQFYAELADWRRGMSRIELLEAREREARERTEAKEGGAGGGGDRHGGGGRRRGGASEFTTFDPETGMRADGTFAGLGSEPSQHAGLGHSKSYASARDGAAANDANDMYSAYRRLRSAGYHEMIASNPFSSNMSRGGK